MTDRIVESARMLLRTGRVGQARALLSRALAGRAGDAELNQLMGHSFASQGQYSQAEFYLRRAAAARPSDAGILNDLGNVLALTDRLDEAVDALTAATAADPDNLAAAVSLAAALNTKNLPVTAAAHCARAAQRLAGSPDLAIAHATALRNAARAGEADLVLRSAAALHPGHPELLQRLAFNLNYVPGAEPTEIARSHRAAASALAAAHDLPAQPEPRPIDQGKQRLRVGLLSPDLRAHSVACFARAIIQHLDRGQFEVVCYSDTRAEDQTSASLRSLAPQWRNVDPLDDLKLADAIRADGIDILIELAGYTAKTRHVTLLLRPAPVQATYIGYPNTTGLPTVDYRIVDERTDPSPSSDPAADADTLCTERLVRLDDCFLCYTPPVSANEAPVRPPPSLAAGHITFGSFNAVQKINEPLMRLWARVLGAVPGSRLVLKSAGLDEPELRSDLSRRLVGSGIAPERIGFLPWASSQAEHLALYGKIDIALDTFPYTGTTTTCEAMWMGVPVVSLVGRSHASRVGLSLLSAVGLAELCAPDEVAYVAAATKLAGDRVRLGHIRGSLRARLERSALGEGPAYGRRLGHVLRAMWEDAARRRPSRPNVRVRNGGPLSPA